MIIIIIILLYAFYFVLSEFYFDSQALTFLESVFLFKFQMAGAGRGVSGNQKVAGGSGSLAGDKQWLG